MLLTAGLFRCASEGRRTRDGSRRESIPVRLPHQFLGLLDSLAVGTLAFALAACRADLTSEIYVQDIREWSAPGSQQHIPITLTAYVPGAASNCNDLWEPMRPIVERYLPEAKLAGCNARQGAVEDTLNISAIMNVVSVKPSESLNVPGLLSLTIMSEKVTAEIGGTQREGVYLQLHASPTAVEALRRDLRDKNPLADFDLEGLQFSIAINNDEREPAELVLRGVFADNTPIDVASTGSGSRECRRHSDADAQTLA